MGSLEHNRTFERGQPPPGQGGKSVVAPQLVEKVAQSMMTRRERVSCQALDMMLWI